MCLVISIRQAVLGRDALRMERNTRGSNPCSTRRASWVWHRGDGLLLGTAWPQPPYGESALVVFHSGHEFVFRGTSQRRDELGFIPAMVLYNLHDSLGLAGNSLTHRKSWEERELKRMTLCSFRAGRYQQRLGWVGLASLGFTCFVSLQLGNTSLLRYHLNRPHIFHLHFSVSALLKQRCHIVIFTRSSR